MHNGRRSAARTALCFLAALFVAGFQLYAQESTAPVVQPGVVTPPSGKLQVGPGQPVEDKRAFGVLPNYRTAESTSKFVPLTTRQKFKIATADSFDYAVLGTTGFFAGLSQLEGSNNDVYHQGIKGFAHRYGISYADQVTGNYFPEAIVPTIFHLDPRYFRRGEGTAKSRLLYALSRTFVCRTDTGAQTFNANEFVGNALAATFAMSYHPHERTIGDAVSQAGTFIESDTAGNVIKEFWPDVKRWYKRRHNKAGD